MDTFAPNKQNGQLELVKKSPDKLWQINFGNNGIQTKYLLTQLFLLVVAHRYRFVCSPNPFLSIFFSVLHKRNYGDWTVPSSCLSNQGSSFWYGEPSETPVPGFGGQFLISQENRKNSWCVLYCVSGESTKLVLSSCYKWSQLATSTSWSHMSSIVSVFGLAG